MSNFYRCGKKKTKNGRERRFPRGLFQCNGTRVIMRIVETTNFVIPAKRGDALWGFAQLLLTLRGDDFYTPAPYAPRNHSAPALLDWCPVAEKPVAR